jgi:pimeloyl-ACP methyl ester carboxylesterase
VDGQNTCELEQHYDELGMAVVIVTGADDQIADARRQSERLHQKLPRSEFIRVPGAGHMIHHLAPHQVVAAIDRLAQLPRHKLPARSCAEK